MRFLRIADVCHLTTLSPSTVYQLMAEGKFPKTFNISPGRKVWLESDVEEWMRERLREAGRDVKPGT